MHGDAVAGVVAHGEALDGEAVARGDDRVGQLVLAVEDGPRPSPHQLAAQRDVVDVHEHAAPCRCRARPRSCRPGGPGRSRPGWTGPGCHGPHVAGVARRRRSRRPPRGASLADPSPRRRRWRRAAARRAGPKAPLREPRAGSTRRSASSRKAIRSFCSSVGEGEARGSCRRGSCRSRPSPRTAALLVEEDDLLQRLVPAVVHVGRGQGHVAQRRHLEGPRVGWPTPGLLPGRGRASGPARSGTPMTLKSGLAKVGKPWHSKQRVFSERKRVRPRRSAGDERGHVALAVAVEARARAE